MKRSEKFLATLGLGILTHLSPVFANEHGWMVNDDCQYSVASQRIGGDTADLYITIDSKFWFGMPGDLASTADRQTIPGQFSPGRVMEINGRRMKAEVTYYAQQNTLLIAPSTPEGSLVMASMLNGKEAITIKYGERTIKANFPSLDDGMRSIIKCNPPI
ncbi:MAG: hypothetical protein ACRC7D_20800 [Aeromonas popoffii]|uniref:hypothetical protein n=1 Tax=Aeromonas popoffii TaxID=70856 RepID=UPI003F355AD5